MVFQLEKHYSELHMLETCHTDSTFPITIRECVALGRTVKAPLQRLTKEDWAKVDEAIEEVGLSELATRQIGALSGGQRCVPRRVVWFKKQIIIFLDEPFVGIDMLSEKVIMTIIRKMERRRKNHFNGEP